jgi:pantoate--beta-alanine ligase
MAAKCFPALEVVPCATLREEDGLAMSSRNRRLNEDERKLASSIPRILTEAKKLGIVNAKKLKNWVQTEFEKVEGIKLEYFEIANDNTLQTVDIVDKNSRMFIAAYIGDVRLIDNV